MSGRPLSRPLSEHHFLRAQRRVRWMSVFFATCGSRPMTHIGGKFRVRIRSATITAKRKQCAMPQPQGRRAMVNQCPLCQRRVSDWRMARRLAAERVVSGKNEICHNECLADHKLRTGMDYGEPHGNGHNTPADRTVGLSIRNTHSS